MKECLGNQERRVNRNLPCYRKVNWSAGYFLRRRRFSEMPGNKKKGIAESGVSVLGVLLDEQSRSFIAKRRQCRFVSVYKTLGYKLRLLV